WNLYATENSLTVFDWENFELCAPVLLDPLYFVLSTNVLISKNHNSSQILASLYQILFGKTQQNSWIADVALACVYLKLHTSGGVVADTLDRCAKQLRCSLSRAPAKKETLG